MTDAPVSGTAAKAPMVALLMTRPRQASQHFVAQLPLELQAQITVIYAPLMQITPLNTEIDFQGYTGLIFTSANGVAAAGEAPVPLPAFCVGQRTTAAAEQAGWQAQLCGGSATELVTYLCKVKPAAPLLHLHGRHTRGDIAQTLTAAGLPCEGQVVYEQQLLSPSGEMKQKIIEQTSVIVPLFSPRTARHFASLGLDQVNLSLIALSQAVAAEVKGLHYKDLQVSKTPDARNMAVMVRDAAVRLAHLEGGNPAQ
ncbi:uroporphyrinogen-III synthase [Pseudophaeobacter sp.]|uniref:uroporphyrinogen-III synthase n=1 Tax=Pseudophaeobacter sp. TaxID=1971739 RepID=UPI003296B83D